MLDAVPIFSSSECKKIRSVVYDLRHLWISRNRQFPFYTLAVASYLDAAERGTYMAYCENAAVHNTVLKENFGWMFERLAQTLSAHLQAPVAYCETFALPGFHVFLMHEYFRQLVASVHCDLQYQLLDWGPPEAVDFTRPLSFTASISIPRSGAGLYVWNLEQSEIENLSSWQRKTLIETRRRVLMPYEEGKLVLHSGHSVHQIAPMANAQPDEERITLQGHAILRNNVWQLYW